MASIGEYSGRVCAPSLLTGAARRMPPGTYRFLLALIVFFSHTRLNVFDFTNTSTGFIAVICFFVVSGFIIARVLDTVYVGNVGHFVVNRALRIYPVMTAATISRSWLSSSTAVSSLGQSQWKTGRGLMQRNHCP